eukprot:764171-Hanusia_phi.AAC.5
MSMIATNIASARRFLLRVDHFVDVCNSTASSLDVPLPPPGWLYPGIPGASSDEGRGEEGEKEGGNEGEKEEGMGGEKEGEKEEGKGGEEEGVEGEKEGENEEGGRPGGKEVAMDGGGTKEGNKDDKSDSNSGKVGGDNLEMKKLMKTLEILHRIKKKMGQD